VHPTKAEVRFREQSLVHEVVRRALMETLGESSAPSFQLRSDVVTVQPATVGIPGVLAGGTFPSRWLPGQVPRAFGGSSLAVVSGHSAAIVPPDLAIPSDLGPVGREADALGIRPMIPLGQFRDTFIIAVDDEGIAVIDQHVAHERVLFERVMQRLTAGPLESQRLLVPLIIDLPSAAIQSLVGRTSELARLGFEIETFGETTIRVGAVPGLLDRESSAQALRGLAEDLEGLDHGAHVQEALRRIAATTACHAAVKAHCPLTYEKMTHILAELRATAYSTVCPHGRPVMLRLSRREIEKNFERI
jgi:DNA mismatch repair protein MutL